MAKVEFAFVALCLTLLTACGDPIPPGALISPLPTKTPVHVAPVVPTADDPYKVERLDTPEAALVKLRKTNPAFVQEEKKSLIPLVAKRGVLKNFVLVEAYIDVDVNQPVWYVEVRLPNWTEKRGPAGYERTFEYNTLIFVRSVETSKSLTVQKRLV